MKSILLLLSLTAIYTAAELNPDGLRRLEQQSCGVAKESPGLIIGGDEVIPGSRPWMALIKNNVNGGKNSSYSCIGTLITDQFVLTAAHCVHGFDIESVRLGEHQLTKDVDCIQGKKTQCFPNIESFGVEQVIIHDKYTSPESLPYDIALLKLNRKVDFKDHISPICLPINATLEEQATSLETLLLTAWGADINGLINEKLLEVNIDNRMENRRGCFRKIPSMFISDNDICISYNSNIMCNGISGSPLTNKVEYFGVKRFVQFAFLHFGVRPCGPSLGIIVAKHMPWITNILANH